MVYDAPDYFNALDLPERSQCGNERFRLDYSSIIDESNRNCGKKRALFTNTNIAKNKYQRRKDTITDLLQLSESEGEGN